MRRRSSTRGSSIATKRPWKYLARTATSGATIHRIAGGKQFIMAPPTRIELAYWREVSSSVSSRLNGKPIRMRWEVREMIRPHPSHPLMVFQPESTPQMSRKARSISSAVDGASRPMSLWAILRRTTSKCNTF